MEETIATMWQYLTNLDLWNFFVFTFNYYFPFGMFWWMLGLVLATVVYLKSQNLLYSLLVATAYFNIIANTNLVVHAYSLTAMRLVGLGLVLIMGYYLYQAVRGR